VTSIWFFILQLSQDARSNKHHILTMFTIALLTASNNHISEQETESDLGGRGLFWGTSLADA